MIIYKVTNNINGKIYIGQTTKGLDHRRQRHEWENDKCCFHNALRKYGKESFEWQILECCDSKEELDEMEFHYIKQYKSLSPNGYNLTLGGEGVVGNKCSEESKIKMSIAHTGIKMPPFSEEHKRKISESHMGNKNPNFGKKMSEHNKIILISIHKGKIISEETRRRMSLAAKNKYAKKRTMEG